MNLIKFFTYTTKLINIRAKVYLDPLIRSKVIYLKLQQNIVISLHKSLNQIIYYFIFCSWF